MTDSPISERYRDNIRLMDLLDHAIANVSEIGLYVEGEETQAYLKAIETYFREAKAVVQTKNQKMEKFIEASYKVFMEKRVDE